MSCLFCANIRPTLRKLRAEDMFETWVSDIHLGAKATQTFSIYQHFIFKVTIHYCLPFSQEDDIEGIHIVAFAEEEDPGESICIKHVNVKVSFR